MMDSIGPLKRHIKALGKSLAYCRRERKKAVCHLRESRKLLDSVLLHISPGNDLYDEIRGHLDEAGLFLGDLDARDRRG